MSSLRPLLFATLAILALAVPVPAAAQAIVDAEASVLEDDGAAVSLRLTLSKPVPWRAFTLDDPRRLVLDLGGVNWPEALRDETEKAGPVRMVPPDDGWSRLVVPLSEPMGIGQAVLKTGEAGRARLDITLKLVSAEAFRTAAGAPDGVEIRPDSVAQIDKRAMTTPVRVMLDPGHGGFDPGAEAGGLVEADLMLTFAGELRALLLQDGDFEVALTREDDSFVSLAKRITAARAFGADVLLSLHADALPEEAGHASGATVYTLSREASDIASQKLAERHDRADLIRGVDLDGHEERVALVLMDLVRRETAPRSLLLAETLLSHIRAGTGHVSGRPQRMADFSVLRAPDIASVLLELGFLSSERDRGRLSDASWRQATALSIRDALRDWSARDRAANASEWSK